MGLISSLTTFVANTTIRASEVNAWFSEIRTKFNTYAVLTDEAKTITAGHTFSGAQTFSGGVTASGATTHSGTLNVSGNLQKGGAAASGTVLRGDGTTYKASTLTVPDTVADKSIIYASAANTLAALAVGSAGQVLTVSGGAPSWQNPVSGVAVVDGWSIQNVAADAGPIGMERYASGNENEWVATRSGSVTALWARTSAARSAGDIVVTLVKNGVAQALTATIDGTNTQTHYNTAAAGTYTFVAGDALSINYDSTSWSPTTADLAAGLEVTFTA